MKTYLKLSFLGLLIASVFLISSCKKNDDPKPDLPGLANAGVYILNQGFDPDASELSYFDYFTSKMTNDLFVSANPDKKLGSGANDMGIYGSKLYITVDGSDKVEVLNSTTGKMLKTVDILSPRFVAFHGGRAFVTSYTDKVFVIDTATYAIVKEIHVGRTPEQLAVSGNKIFVANAGWQDYVFNGGKHDNTVSVIDGNSLEVIETIEVADNVVNVYADNKNHVFVNAATIYEEDHILSPSRLYVIDVNTLKLLEHEFDFGVQQMAIHKDQACLFTKDQEDGKTRFLLMNTADFELKELERFENASFIYGLDVDPNSGNIWVANAGDFVSPGKVYYHNVSTKVTETYTAGVIPCKFVFKY